MHIHVSRILTRCIYVDPYNPHKFNHDASCVLAHMYLLLSKSGLSAWPISRACEYAHPQSLAGTSFLPSCVVIPVACGICYPSQVAGRLSSQRMAYSTDSD